MNKMVRILVLDLLIFMVGCNENKEKMQEGSSDKVENELTCIYNHSYYDYYIIEESFTFKFSEVEENLEEYSYSSIFNYGNYLDEEDNINFYGELFENCTQLRQLGIMCNVSKENNALILLVNFFVKDLNEEGKERFHVDYIYNDWKDWLESGGYFCK